jgi:hypothetical protein
MINSLVCLGLAGLSYKKKYFVIAIYVGLLLTQFRQLIRVLDLEESKASMGDELFDSLKFAQYSKSAINFAIINTAFW